jgi:ring-1,2-phenylacetyl-CoA epoxidase subunit PaaD
MVTADAVVSAVTDPELPMLTLADLGILRSVTEADGRVVVTITPTYTACPAIETMRYDITRALSQAGYAGAEVRTELAPAWSSDWITPEGRRKLAEAGIAPPGAVRGQLAWSRARTAARPRLSWYRSSGLPRAGRCGAARPAGSPSST